MTWNIKLIFNYLGSEFFPKFGIKAETMIKYGHGPRIHI